MKEGLWSFYINNLQGHPSPCDTNSFPQLMEEKIGKIFSNKDGKVLILGCGGGGELTSFRELGYEHLTGITLDHHCTDRQVCHLDMQDLTKLRNEFYDYVYCNQTFEHAFAPFLFCLEIWAVMKPGGLWYIEYPSHESTGRSGLTDPLTKITSHHHPNMLRAEDATLLFQVTGFKCISYTPGGNEIFILEKIPLALLIEELDVHPDVYRTLSRRLHYKNEKY